MASPVQTKPANRLRRRDSEPIPEWEQRKRRRELLLKMGTTSLAAALLVIFLMPMGYAFVTSLKTS